MNEINIICIYYNFMNIHTAKINIQMKYIKSNESNKNVLKIHFKNMIKILIEI
jgi:hypothetical protein